ncbi:MAG TPA: hypothetical protein DCR21_04115 [Succinivibrionaceae bacterium]|nr:hypothetical protein [Succinivibrionaceae bacterium]
MEILSSIYDYVLDYFLEDAYLMGLQGVGLLLLFLAIWATLAYYRSQEYLYFKNYMVNETDFIGHLRRMDEAFRIAMLFCLLGVFLITCSIALIFSYQSSVVFKLDVTELIASVFIYAMCYLVAVFGIQLANITHVESES